MIRGDRIYLRTMKASDLELYHTLSSDIESRGRFYPLDIKSEKSLQNEFEKNGFWGPEFGILLICTSDENLPIGIIVYFKTAHYYEGYELGYRIFDPTNHGKGYATEATRLMSKFMFDSKRILRLTIQCEPGNIGSRKVAEKSGYKFEGIARSVFESYGKVTDIEVWSLIHADIYSDPSYA